MGREEESSQKKGKKHSRKDIASYASDERGVTFETSRTPECERGAEESHDGERGGGKNTLVRKKSNPPQCISGQVEGEGWCACVVASVNLDSRK